MNNKTFSIIFIKHALFTKCLWVFMALFLSVSCKSKQPVLTENNTTGISENCPENDMCSLEVLQNKKLNILRDNLGEIYPEIADGNQLLLKFKFEKNADLNVADGHYIEEIYIELNPNNLQKETTDFKKENLLFARLCFCKGQTGYYRIRTGRLSVKNIKDGTYKIDFNFKIDEVPQIITSITEIFSLK
tara:strand:- start:137828 stop:138394 length:567 start_codon:yes stop_codon:yes gene_type:complete